MKLLVFDTCFNKSYITLRENNEIIETRIIKSDDTNYHSAYLIPEIRNILKRNNLLMNDIDALGVNIGPGSFTGIRASITIARVLAQQTNAKIVGVPSLEVLSKINKSEKDTLVITDARKNKVYIGLYSKQNKILISPKLEEKENIFSYINDNIFIITDATINEFLKEKDKTSTIYEDCNDNIGLYLSEIAYNKLLQQEEDYHWAKVKPLYIQQPSITRPKENKNV